jgi:hypothetical protein
MSHAVREKYFFSRYVVKHFLELLLKDKETAQSITQLLLFQAGLLIV